MAMIQCDFHGLQGVTCTCSHIYHAVVSNINIQYSEACFDEFILPCMLLCSECKIKWDKLIIEEDKEDFLNTLSVVCGPCFNEWHNRHTCA